MLGKPRHDQSKILHSRKTPYRNNTSGVTGVHKRKSDGRYYCSICINSKIYATTRNNFSDAIEWRKNMERKLLNYE